MNANPTLAERQRIASRVMLELRPYCEKIEIAGSIRRERPFVRDIDIVVLPKPGQLMDLIARASAKTKLLKGGEQYQVFEMSNGVQLDLWIAHAALPAKKDMFNVVEVAAKPSNFGMLLLSRTGSYQHNIYLCQRAREMGMHMNPHAGITQAGIVVASETEEDIFKALSSLSSPERRER